MAFNSPEQDVEQEEGPFLQRIRNMFFPIKPADGTLVRWLKNSAFYSFGVMLVLVSLVFAVVVICVL